MVSLRCSSLVCCVVALFGCSSPPAIDEKFAEAGKAYLDEVEILASYTRYPPEDPGYGERRQRVEEARIRIPAGDTDIERQTEKTFSRIAFGIVWLNLARDRLRIDPATGPQYDRVAEALKSEVEKTRDALAKGEVYSIPDSQTWSADDK